MFHRFRSLMWVLVIVSATSAVAVSYNRDPGDPISVTIKGEVLPVYFYRPQNCGEPSLLFIFHGLSRTASSYRNYAKELADRECMIVYAPLFNQDAFPSWRYNRGGIKRGDEVRPSDQWTVSYVNDLVAWARKAEKRPDAPYYLFGHSAGGQFLSRVAAFGLPLDAMRIVIANPSTYVLPSFEEPAPYGLGGVFEPQDQEPHLRAYLNLPITIYLGEDDVGDQDLTQNAAAVRQGENRFERGEFVFQLAKATAEARGWDFGWKKTVVPRVGHSARDLLAHEHAVRALGLPELSKTP